MAVALPLVLAAAGVGAVALADDGKKKKKGKKRRAPKSTPHSRAAAAQSATKFKERFSMFREGMFGFGQSSRGSETDPILKGLSEKERSAVIKKLEKKLEDATAEACKKLKKAYGNVPSIQRLTCKESPSELVGIMANDSLVGLTGGMSIAVGIDIKGDVRDAINAVGRQIESFVDKAIVW